MDSKNKLNCPVDKNAELLRTELEPNLRHSVVMNAKATGFAAKSIGPGSKSMRLTARSGCAARKRFRLPSQVSRLIVRNAAFGW